VLIGGQNALGSYSPQPVRGASAAIDLTDIFNQKKLGRRFSNLSKGRARPFGIDATTLKRGASIHLPYVMNDDELQLDDFIHELPSSVVS